MSCHVYLVLNDHARSLGIWKVFLGKLVGLDRLKNRKRKESLDERHLLKLIAAKQGCLNTKNPEN